MGLLICLLWKNKKMIFLGAFRNFLEDFRFEIRHQKCNKDQFSHRFLLQMDLNFPAHVYFRCTAGGQQVFSLIT